MHRLLPRLSSGLVTLVLLWLTSVDCLALCVTQLASLGSEACHQAEHTCCSVPETASTTATPAFGRLTPEALPCPLLATSYGVSERPRDEVERSVATEQTVNVAILEESRSGFAPPRGSAPILDRGGTYLRCCVFLI